MQVGDVVLGFRLAAEASVPSAGRWFLTTATQHGVPVWIRDPSEDATPRQATLAWERLRNLSHPGIPRVVAFSEADGALAVAAPRGVPISRLIEHRQDPDFAMNPGTVLDAGLQLADVLVHAHEGGRPHGHVDPGRIWLDAAGHLLVWGFEEGPTVAPDPAWQSPDHARGLRASGDADQWAVGSIIAALVTGRIPWTSDDPEAEARVGDASHLSGPVLDQWKPLGRMVERAVQAAGRDRFSSIHPLRQALHAMSERVRQPSSLDGMGARLMDRFGPALPEPTEVFEEEQPTVVAEHPEDVPEPSIVAPAELPPEDVEEPDVSPSQQTTLESEPEVPRTVSFSTVDFEGPDTHLGTTPTKVPVAAREVTGPRERIDELATAVVEDGEDGPSTFGDVAVASRIPIAEEAPGAGGFDIVRVAPWVVGAMLVLLLVYVATWMA